MTNQRNLIFAVLLSGLLLLGWDLMIGRLYPQPKPVVEASASASAALPGDTAGDAAATPEPTTNPRNREGGLTDPRDMALEAADLKTALAAPARVRIDAPEILGSINLVGARIDDITLKTHRQTVEMESGPVRLYSPEGTPAQHFAQFGWIGENVKVPDARTLWTAQGGTLTADNPVTLRWDNGEGLTFAIKLSIDKRYMITAQQSVTNTGTGAVVLRPFALINRTSRTASADIWNVHSGPIGSFGDAVQYDPDYDDLVEAGSQTPEGKPHWIGFTDVYWLSALVPGTGAAADFRSLGNEHFRADLIYAPETLAPGKQVTTSTRLFAGAKESVVLDQYQDAGIQQFGLAIDWGWFRWFEKPILWLLRQLFAFAGNFGVAIILLTVIIRGLMFPIAQKQFASMAAMKAIQPKMKAIQERYKDDKPKQQQEIMALYKSEGVNPLAGCLPMLIQIPIFFALYKVLMLAIEMRHQPFVLWIKDLSAPDPAHILNLFGLLPFTPPSFLAIGVLAVLLGFTMWLTFRLNPTAMDPVQQQMFAIMPWVLMFVMAPFAAGLLLYWVTSNVLTLAQQSYLYSRHPQLKAASDKQKSDQDIVAARDKERAKKGKS